MAFDWPLISIWFNKNFWKWLVRLFYDTVKVLKPLNYIPKNGWNVNLEYITVKSCTLFPMSSFWVWRLRVANRLIHPFTEAQNSVSKFLQCCLRCCFWCLEKMVKFLNRNAYIMVSRPLLVYGALALPSWPHVCPTAWRAFWYLVIDFVTGISGYVIPRLNQGYTFLEMLLPLIAHLRGNACVEIFKVC